MCVSLQELCCLIIAPGDKTIKNIVDKMSRSGEGVPQMSTSPLARWTSSAKTGCSMVVVESLQVLDHHAPSMVLVLESLWIVWHVGTPKCDQGQSVTAGGSSFSSSLLMLLLCLRTHGSFMEGLLDWNIPRQPPQVGVWPPVQTERTDNLPTASTGSHWRSHRHLWLTMLRWKPWSCSTHPLSSHPHGSSLSWKPGEGPEQNDRSN